MSMLQLSKHIRENLPPDNRWNNFEVEVLCYSRSFKKADKKAQDAQDTSNIESSSSFSSSETESRKRKIQVPARYRGDTTDDDLPNCINYNKSPNKKKRFEIPALPSFNVSTEVPAADPNKKKRFETPALPSFNVSTEVPAADPNEVSQTILEIPQSMFVERPNEVLSETPDEFHGAYGISNVAQEISLAIPGITNAAPEFSLEMPGITNAAPEISLPEVTIAAQTEIPLLELMTRMFHAIEKIKKQLEQMSKQQAELNAQLVNIQIASGKEFTNPMVYNPLPELALPIATDTDLINLNQKLTKDSKLSSVLVCYLSNIAYGKCLSFFTTNLLKKFLVRDVALLYSRLGRKGKKSLEDLREIFNVLLATMSLRFPEAKREELSERLGKVLSSAKEWGMVKEKRPPLTDLNYIDNSLEFSDDKN